MSCMLSFPVSVGDLVEDGAECSLLFGNFGEDGD